jgi:uncharacterized repeat protein (TIGR02543 family)
VGDDGACFFSPANEAAQSATFGGRVTAPSTSPTDGFGAYNFEGWHLDAACTTAWAFGAGGTALDSANVTGASGGSPVLRLYAKWAPRHDWQISYKKNNPGGGAQPDYTQGGQTALGKATLLDAGEQVMGYAVPGYYFAGWSLTPDGAALVDEDGSAPGTQLTLASNPTTLYAKWLPKTVKVTYDVNASQHPSLDAAAPEVADAAFDGTIAAAPAVPVDGAEAYGFAGWHADAATSTPWTFGTGADATRLTAANTQNQGAEHPTVTLYAKWELKGDWTIRHRHNPPAWVEAQPDFEGGAFVALGTQALSAGPSWPVGNDGKYDPDGTGTYSFAVPGYDFVGWFAAPSGGNALTSVATSQKTTDVYAQWAPKGSVPVTFYRNRSAGDTGGASS